MSNNKHINEDGKFNNIVKGLKKEPVLKDPEQLTDSILKEIENEKHITSEKKPIYRTIFIMKRVLAAASVVLLIVFGVEQYIFVDKLIQLENKNSDVEQRSQQLKGLNFMLRNIDIEKLMLADQDNKEPGEYKKFLKARIQQARLLALNLEKSEINELNKIRNLFKDKSLDIEHPEKQNIKEKRYN